MSAPASSAPAASTQFRTFTSRVCCLPGDHVDTDQIIPARYLKTTTREGLGAGLFADWRYDEEGRERPDFPLNDPQQRGARVLLAGDNFGCGSSREHAAWALVDHGFRAVIAPRFADIFRQNAVVNGLLPIELPKSAWRLLLGQLAASPRQQVRIDLQEQRVDVLAPQPWSEGFAIEPFARHCLLRGVDTLDYLLSRGAEIARFEQTHPPRVDTRRGPGAAVLAAAASAGDRP